MRGFSTKTCGISEFFRTFANKIIAMEYKYYMQRIDKPNFEVVDLEKRFRGLRYLKAEGMNDIGKSKNVYTEDYAESDRLRHYIPEDDNYTNQATTVNMTFLIIGEAVERQRTFDEFTEYVRVGVHKFWDTARNREFDFVVQGEIKPSDEKWHGDVPYIEILLPLQNLNGKTTRRRELVNP